MTSPPYYALRSYLDAAHPDKHREIGSEATPDEYLATMVAVFREVRRVLRPDGTCWVNIGDSTAVAAAITRMAPSNLAGSKQSTNHGSVRRDGVPGLAAKQLLLMPARLALALQADGWWVRSDIIWHKPNPMPESCRDRPTSAHEHIFMLTKSARYYFDSVAIAEPTEASSLERLSQDVAGQVGSMRANGGAKTNGPMRAVGGPTRSCRNVWTLATDSFAAAHFATYPPALAERCIKAGTSERGCCSQCGKPWVRALDVETRPNAPSLTGKYNGDGVHRTISGGVSNDARLREDRGWRAGCDHDAPTVPCTVLDHFAGAGTTLLVADRLQRDAIGIELNTSYTEMAMERCRGDAPLLHEMGPVPEHPVETEIADLFAEAAE